MKIFLAGLSYKTAPVEVRERLALPGGRLRCCGCRLKVAGKLSELVLVSTCNRVELYGVAPEVTVGMVRRLFEELSGSDSDFTPYLYVKEGKEAVEHLFSVASGLDSMVLGETEISGQIKQAYQAAQEAKMTGKFTNRLFQSALQVGKEIRTQTGIGRGATSVGSVAVELAERIFDEDLSDKTVMIIGAGKMGEACMRHLAKRSPRAIVVANRSYERAVHLASEFGGEPLHFDDFLSGLSQADIVVSSTGCPHTILQREQVAGVMAARKARPLFLIDIAVPRDIDPEVQQLDGVYLYNVDHLEALVRENVRQREQELERCREIITERSAALLERWAAARQHARSADRVNDTLSTGEAGTLAGLLWKRALVEGALKARHELSAAAGQ
jgi:glutamyl-tRNA reductase